MFKSAILFASANAFCNYPMWGIPGTGSEGRCDHEDGCPMLPEAYCNDIYGVTQDEECTVYCRGNPDKTETWECVGEDEW